MKHPEIFVLNVISFMILVNVAISVTVAKDYYKRGQVHALRGEVKFYEVVHETPEWKRIKE